jgi:hypothetical protein
MTVWAKSRLLSAGLKEAKMGFITNIADTQAEGAGTVVSPNETVMGVLNLQTQAGVTYRKPFERYKHRGPLVSVDRFPVIPRVFAAREGLEPKIIEGLRQVIHVLKVKEGFESLTTDPPQAMVAVDDSYFEDLRKAMKDAEQFDGHPASVE